MAILLLNRFTKKELDILDWFNDFTEDIFMVTTEDAANEYKGLPELISLPTLLNNNRVEFEIEKLFKRNPFRIIIGLEETDIVRAGVIRDRYNLTGQSEYSARAFRDKVLMKTLAQEGGINVPAFKKIQTPFDIIDFIKEFDYPILIKPIDGMASRGITVIRCEDELEQWLENGLTNGYMVEKFEDNSDVFHVDGIFINGEIIFSSASKYIVPLIEFNINNGSGSILLSPENPINKPLKKFVYQILKTLPTPNITSFHAEIFYNKETEELKMCEIASRTIGGQAVELIKNSYEIDLDRYITRAQSGKLDELKVEQRIQSACYFVPPSIGYLEKIPDQPEFEWCVNFQCYGKHNHYYNGPKKVLDHFIYFLVEGEDDQEIKQRISIMLKYIEENTIWRITENKN